MKKVAIAVMLAFTLALTVAMPVYAETNSGDPNPPSVGSVSVDKPKVTVGDTFTVSYDVEDADGVASVDIGITADDPSVEPDPSQGQSVGAWRSSTDSQTHQTFSVTSSDKAGCRWVWALRVTDKAGYVNTIYDETYAKTHGVDGPTADLSALTWEVLEHGGDPNPPSVGSVSVDKPKVTVGDTFTVSYDVEDADGVASVDIGITADDPSVEPDPSQGQSVGAWRSSTDSQTHQTFSVTSSDKAGCRWVWALRVTDKAGYVNTIYDETYAKTHGVDGPTADLSALTWEIVAPSEIPSYSVLDGEAAKYEKGSESGISFRFSGAAADLFSVQVDGVTISADNYTVTSGSTIVTLKASYLETLSEGNHTITAYYKDGGRATASFSVAAKDQKKEETNDGATNNQASDQSKDAEDTQQGNVQQGEPDPAKDTVKSSTPKTGDQSAFIAALAAVAVASLAAGFARIRARR